MSAVRRQIAAAGAAVAMLLGGCAQNAAMEATAQERADRELAAALEGRVRGEPVDCVSASGLEAPRIIDRDTLLYRPVSDTVWRNELPVGCTPLRGGSPTLIVELHGSQLCRNDSFRVLEQGASIPSVSCRLGQFIPYRRPD